MTTTSFSSFDLGKNVIIFDSSSSRHPDIRKENGERPTQSYMLLQQQQKLNNLLILLR